MCTRTGGLRGRKERGQSALKKDGGVCGDPHSGKNSERLDSNSAREVQAGEQSWGETGQPKGLCTDTRPQVPATGCFGSCSFPEGLQAQLSQARETSGLPMTPISASNASAGPRTGGPAAPGAGSTSGPTGQRSPAEKSRLKAPWVSYSHSQPCGSRTRLSCCNQSQDWPIVLAAAGSSAPGPRGQAGPGPRPVALSCLRTSPEQRATRTRGAIGQRGLSG